MEKKFYETPCLEVVEMEMPVSLLAGSLDGGLTDEPVEEDR